MYRSSRCFTAADTHRTTYRPQHIVFELCEWLLITDDPSVVTGAPPGYVAAALHNVRLGYALEYIAVYEAVQAQDWAEKALATAFYEQMKALVAQLKAPVPLPPWQAAVSTTTIRGGRENC